MAVTVTNTVEQIIVKTEEFVGGGGWNYFWMILIVLGGFILGRLLKVLMEKAASKLNLGVDAFRMAWLSLISRTIMFPTAGLGICFALKVWVLPEQLGGLRDDVVGVLLTVIVAYIIYQGIELVNFWMKKLTAQTHTTLDDMMVPLVRKTLRILTVVLGLVQVAQQLSDKPITSILAGLGVGGLAVALAAQDTIKNFFGSLVIFADHPFQLGDRIVANGEDGIVEEVGMRSTRIRTLDGHLVTVPNGELANMMVRNISKRPYIKRVANITLTYDTPPEKVERAMEIIREFLDAHNEKMHPDMPNRVFFNNFNDCSLNILVIYWFAPPDYWAFMEFDQQFNLAVLKSFNEESIDFAFPTRTLYLAGDPSRPLNIGSDRSA
ncbi:mechanosensitive ion channel family protein [Tichowtungia aerotolerans]|uniref:Mechanosensitive ion channel n=1 Tax=Tichowtungia aerotolerans TaxID=2697043 RepID=A0A6P1M7G7_9BACT|nr:mechanosensitive ion channel family protein [Tichowtungia aerotolerans]QHI70689.1 mechanosensitive ion channel [Tichowtungia aerotolerans]